MTKLTLPSDLYDDLERALIPYGVKIDDGPVTLEFDRIDERTMLGQIQDACWQLQGFVTVNRDTHFKDIFGRNYKDDVQELVMTLEDELGFDFAPDSDLEAIELVSHLLNHPTIQKIAKKRNLKI